VSLKQGLTAQQTLANTHCDLSERHYPLLLKVLKHDELENITLSRPFTSSPVTPAVVTS
jgi:hypothetical protein